MPLGRRDTEGPARRARRWALAPALAVVILTALGATVELTGVLDGFRPADAASDGPAQQRPTMAERLAQMRRSLHAPRPSRQPAPLRVVRVTPKDGVSDAPGRRAVVVRFSVPVESGAHPRLSPSTPGHWARGAKTTLTFRPTVPFVPDTTVTMRLPVGDAGVRGVLGGELRKPVTVRWRTADGSTLRLQQLLADLGYLPVAFHSADDVPDTRAAQTEAAYDPPAGSFSWKSDHAPAVLRSLWAPGKYNVMTRGAVMAFQHANGLTMDGVAGHDVWAALIHDAVVHDTADQPYSWAWASKGQPERLRIWRDGSFVFSTLANTGVPEAPTPSGTWPVYARLRTDTMSGTNPDGTHYRDPGIPYVNYFNGGDAVHGFERSGYGYPQSVGCVEVPVSAAKRIWGLIDYGTLVTVTDG
ncbi:MAG: L,D-transpeptidase family protein [Streptosporangiaceae bacterium]